MRKQSAELYPGQRRKEKYKLFKRYRLRVIEDLYRNKLFGLFDHRCFKCGTPERASKLASGPPVLCIDHHVPMALGGHFQAGNLVALCRQCNEAKLDLPPDQFYSPSELERLKPLLAQQETLLAFTFDWDSWHADRGRYLLSLGMEPSLVHELLTNPDHPAFLRGATSRVGVALTVDLEDDADAR